MDARNGGEAPILSVVTPAYNAATFLPEALESVAALRLPKEHIVIDGGSDDGTEELLRSREDPDLIWVSESDRGQTHAVNKGLARARGELIAWLNADDSYVPENAEAAVRALMQDPTLDAVFGFMEIVDEEGRHLRIYRCGPFSWHRYLYVGDYLPTPTLIFRRSGLERVERLDERYADGADCDFYLRLLRGARVRRIRRPLVRFRYHAGSKTGSNVSLQQREVCEIRLRHANSSLGRAWIRGMSRLKILRERVIPSWPDLQERR